MHEAEITTEVSTSGAESVPSPSQPNNTEVEVVQPKLTVPETVPQIPPAVEEAESISILNLWRHALSLQGPAVVRDTQGKYSTFPSGFCQVLYIFKAQYYLVLCRYIVQLIQGSLYILLHPHFSSAVPRTLLSPEFFLMVNLVPQDAPRPLYHDSAANQELLRLFLNDHMLTESVMFDDPRMAQPEGLSLTNLAGRELVFQTHQDGWYYAKIMQALIHYFQTPEPSKLLLYCKKKY